jgi:hypothetical protein
MGAAFYEGDPRMSIAEAVRETPRLDGIVPVGDFKSI